ncbi:type II secretion system F family protein [Candidatus Saccharibacteria bacterium]|nr:type II secretion system F family protein [Candidatus Saccharibacteria bacterium]
MQTFIYTARDLKTGKKITAEVEADNDKTAARLLNERGLAPLEIKPKDEQGGRGIFKRIPSKDRVVFSRQLSTLMNAGLPLVQSLNTVKGQTSNKALKEIIAKIISEVETGSSLADALSAHPKAFDNVYTNLIAAGEASGTLDISLARLADQQEKDSEIMSKIRGALIYPTVVMIVLVGVVVFMLTSVLPQVQNLYSGLPGAKLPVLTRGLLGLSDFILNFWWAILLVLLSVGFFGWRWARSPEGKQWLDHFKMTAWGIGPLYMKLYMARFSRISSTLVASGVPMIKMLATTAEAVDNVHIEASIKRVSDQVKGGKSLSQSLSGDNSFLELVPNMINIGEQSGSLDKMLAKLADYYEKEVDNQIRSISTVVEPAMMIIVGIIALIMVAAVLLPIYSLAGKNLIPKY